MDLFSMGVIDDEDRPKNHAPKKPVVCMEEQFLPAVPHKQKCPRCDCILVDDLWSGMCLACHRFRMDQRRKYESAKATRARKAAQKAAEATKPASQDERRRRISAGLCAHCGARKRLPLSSHCQQRKCRGLE
jgi:hypothetical protein